MAQTLVDIGDFTYYNDLLSPLKSYEWWIRNLSKYSGYGLFMARRKADQYLSYYDDQRNFIHGLAFSYDGDAVCICGLLVESATGDDSHMKDLLLDSPGHIRPNDRQVVNVLVILERDEDSVLQSQYRCQECKINTPATLTDYGNTKLKPYLDFCLEHSHANGGKK